MSYMALYRKWRPGIFEEVKGQEHIVTALKNQIKAERIGHAYLFCGTRGTGKTTVAKLFARAVNCENPRDGSPCEACSACKAIANGSSMNVIEIDAASNNRVDNIREIRDEVLYSPAEGKYKVYIIDEVHMLSTGAFNALLKTLEEPPPYVIFILATTEVHKIPVTILSRCQRYDFRRISVDTIAARLAELIKREHIEAEDKALRYVAKAADGSMRDALSLLDQCVAFYLGQKLTYDNVLEALGATDAEIFGRLLKMVNGHDTKGILDLVDGVMKDGRELVQFVTDFLWYLRNLLLLKTCAGSEDALDLSAENRKLLEKEAAKMELDVVMRYIRVVSELLGQIKYSVQKRVLVEVGLIKLAAPQMETDTKSLLQRIIQLEEKLEKGVALKEDTQVFAHPPKTLADNGAAGQDAEEYDSEKLAEKYDPAAAQDIMDMAAGWKSMIADVDYPMKTFLSEATPLAREDGKGLRLMFPATVKGTQAKAYFDQGKHRDALALKLSALAKKQVEIETGQFSQEEKSPDLMINLSKIKMPVDII